jgi:hypothetical protein
MSLTSQIGRAFREPGKALRYARIVLRSLPYRTRLVRLLPRSFSLTQTPERYVTHLPKYRERGGLYDPADTRKWLSGNPNNAGDMPRFHFLNLACDQILKENITGDVAELGVFRGNSAFLLAKLARRLGTTAYLFDTYEGFDERDLAGVDAKAPAAFSETSIERVKRLVGEENAVFVAGYFPDSLSQVEGDPRFCLVHLDCDLYAPMKAALEYFYPRLVRGGWLIMHDYASLVWDGAEKAVDEFFADKPERIIVIPDKAGTAVIRRAA